MWCVSRLLWSAGAGRFLHALWRFLQSCPRLIWSFLVGFRLTSALTFSLSTIPLYYIAIVISICKMHKDIALSLCNFYIAIVIALCYNVVK